MYDLCKCIQHSNQICVCFRSVWPINSTSLQKNLCLAQYLKVILFLHQVNTKKKKSRSILPSDKVYILSFPSFLFQKVGLSEREYPSFLLSQTGQQSCFFRQAHILPEHLECAKPPGQSDKVYQEMHKWQRKFQTVIHHWKEKKNKTKNLLII